MVYRRHPVVVVVSAITMALIIGLVLISLSQSRPYPGAGVTDKQTLDYDLDQDHEPEHYTLEEQTLIVVNDNRELWRSPADWRVASFQIADVTHDNRYDLLLVVWKRGSFGQSRPFWHTGRDHELTCHLYVYNLVNHRLKPIWMSSALDRPIKDMQIKDTNKDGKNELLVTEYNGRQWFWVWDKTPVSEVTTWQWQEWGFFRVK